MIILHRTFRCSDKLSWYTNSDGLIDVKLQSILTCGLFLSSNRLQFQKVDDVKSIARFVFDCFWFSCCSIVCCSPNRWRYIPFNCCIECFDVAVVRVYISWIRSNLYHFQRWWWHQISFFPFLNNQIFSHFE